MNPKRKPRRRWAPALLVRKLWFRCMISAVCTSVALYASWQLPDTKSLREQLTGALQSTLFLFGFTSGLALFLMSNYVRGLRAETLKLVAEVRKTAWDIYDGLSKSDDPGIQAVAERHIEPLLVLHRGDWFEPDRFQNWSVGIGESIESIEDPEQEHTLLYRHLLPLEESLNELGRYYIRGAVIDLHIQTAHGVFLLLCGAILVNVIARVLPYDTSIDRIVAAACAAVIVLTVMDVLRVFSFVVQEVREENDDFRQIWDGETDGSESPTQQQSLQSSPPKI